MTFILPGSGVYNPPRKYIGRTQYPGPFTATPKMHRTASIDPEAYEVITICGQRISYMIFRLRNMNTPVPKDERCTRCEALEAKNNKRPWRKRK